MLQQGAISSCDKLKDLRLSHNILKVFPESVGTIKGLERLSIGHNAFRRCGCNDLRLDLATFSRLLPAHRITDMLTCLVMFIQDSGCAHEHQGIKRTMDL
jgi:hypothetical protein